jgi:hypothetical protein
VAPRTGVPPVRVPVQARLPVRNFKSLQLEYQGLGRVDSSR